MKAKLDFKSKRTIIIASIIAVLAVGAGVGGYFYAKGNNQSGAANVDNGTSQEVSVDQGNSTKKSDNKKDDNKNPDNKNADNNGEGNGNADNGTNNDNTNNGNAANNGNNNGNANGGNAANNGGANNGNAAGNGGANNNAQDAGDDTDATTVIETVTDLNPWESHSVEWTPEALNVSTPNVDVNKPKLEIEKIAYVKGESLEGKPVNTVAQKGEDITYVIKIKNTGKLDASKVMVYDTIPEGTTLKENKEGTLQTVKDANGKETQRIVWEKDVKAGETISVSFIVTVNVEEDEKIESINLIENKAKVNKDETNITKTPVITSKKVATLIEGEDEKELTNEDFVKPGQTIKYTISAKNDTEVDGVTKITDTVPEGTTLVEKSLNDKVVKTEKEVDGKKVITLEWKNVEVKAKKTTSVSFEVTVNEETPAKIRNVATVGETDTPPTENDVYIDITVNKKWEDKGNKVEHPDITVYLYQNNGERYFKKGTITKKENDTYTFKDLPKFDENGNAYKYTISEEAINTYKAEYNQDEFTITNTLETIDIPVEKIWDDKNTSETYPAITVNHPEITIKLIQGDKEFTSTELNKENNFKDTFKNLPKYDPTGTEYSYKVEELEVIGYDTDYSDDTYTITNTIQTTEINGTKKWEDANDQDGKRPTEIIVELYKTVENKKTKVTEKTVKGDGNTWYYEFTNLPVYENGKKITYTVDEVLEKDSVYTKKVEDTTITNSYTPETTEATVKKVWEDSNNQDGTRPTSLLVTLSNGKQVTLNEENKWTATVKDLPKYENKGQLITYTWTEGQLPEGYELTDTAVNGTVTTLTNTHEPEKTEASVKKEWNDKNNKENKRPTTLTVTLSNGTDVTLNEKNGWTAKVENLPKYANGKEIAYTWTEGSMPAEYELTDTSKNGTVTTLTNSIDWSSIEYEIPVTKIWYDGADAYGKRDDVVISIKAKNLTITKDSEGNDVYTVTNAEPATYTEITTVRLTESDLVSGTDSKWSKKVKVRKYDDNGKEIEYSVEEKSGPSDYTTEIEDNNTVSNAYNNVTIIEDRKGEISDQTYETRLDTVIVLDISGSMDHDGSSTPVEGTGWVYAKPYPISYSYWTMSGNHTITFTDKNNPPTGIDESLIEFVDGQWCFKKGTTARTVSGDRWGYSITADPYTNHQGNSNYEYVDIEFNNRIRAAVKAVNESINAVLYNEDGTRTNSRVALVVYSSSETGNSYNHFNSATMLPLGEYTPNENGEYIHLAQTSGNYNDVVSVVAKTKNGGNVTGNTSSAKVAGGTYTQAGIKQGASILTSNKDEASRTYVSNGKTLSYIPVMILVTDGIPTYYNSQPNVVGDRSGTGYEEDHTQRHDEYTIKTAAFYKAKVSDVYKTECQVYTIGYGLSNNNDAKAMLNPGSSNKSSVLYSGQQYKNIKFDFTENSKTYHCIYDYANGASTTGEADTEAIIDAMKEVVEHIQTYVPSERRVSSLGNVKTAELTDLDRNQSIIIDLTDADGHETLHTYTYDELRTLGAITGDTVDFTNALFNGAKYIMIEYKSTASVGAKFTRFIKSSETVDTIDMDTTNVPLTDKEIEEIEKELAEEAAEKENEEDKKIEAENNNIEENKEVEKTKKENVEEKDEKEDNKDEKEVVEEEKESNSDKEETEKEKVEEKTEKDDNKEKENKGKEENTKTTSTKSSANEQEKTEKVEQETVKTEVTEEDKN